MVNLLKNLLTGLVLNTNAMCSSSKKEGCVAEACGCKVLAKHSNTTGLRNHIRDKHPVEYQQVLKSQGDITASFPSSKDKVQKDNIVLAWAENGLSYRLIESPSFRRAFGDKIPLVNHEFGYA